MVAAAEMEEKTFNQEECLVSMELKQQGLDVDEGNPRPSNSEEVENRPGSQVVEEADRGVPRKEPLREYKKRKRETLGDVDFEALMDASDQGQTRGEADFEESPAMSVGLKEFSVSPIEEVRFKDVLKRRSRIQEYLECRNAILKLWAKDPRRLLLVADCGVSAKASPDESPRASLIREIHEFLDDHGYINIGVVKRMNAEAPEQLQDQHLHQSADVIPMEVDANSEKLSEAREVDSAAETEAVAPRKYERGHSKRKHVVVVGAGPAGLIAARHLDRLNFKVTVFEARNRVGGRVFTDRSTFSVPVDLGASIITGTKSDAETRCDPSTLVCKQLGLELTLIRGDCPMYDSVTGQKVPADLDAAMEEHLNRLLDDTVALVAQSGDEALRMSLGEGLEQCLSKRNKRPDRAGNQETLESEHNQVSVADFAQAKLDELASNEDTLAEVFPDTSVPSQASDEMASLERRIMDWHFANLEYGCAAPLDRVSLPYWNQDEKYGGFAGPHCMIRGGFGTLMEALALGLNIQLEKAVTEISYTAKDVHLKSVKRKQVRIKTSDGEWCEADAVLLTVPLGCLKAQMIKFVPQLPPWKSGAITRLGFGVLNKVVLEFDTIFWDETQEIFGAAPESTESRGKCFMFWNLAKTVDAPVLIALVVGKAALAIQENGPADLVSHAVTVLRRLFGDDRVPEPKKSTVTDWGSDQYSRGAYSYVAVGSSGEDYDTLGRPVENCLFFAGEATCKEHPDTVGGALVTGLKEAVRITDILEGRAYLMEEAESMPEEPEDDRNEVRDMEVRIAAAEYSNSLRAEGSNGDGEEEAISKSHLLKDMFRSAKTPAGRLFLAKEMALLPARTVKDFAGTKGGLTILNTWILDAMRKNRTQLLRLCIRLLLTVGTDILAVRLSGIGRTVKEKVCAHTSRDIRLLARQLVKVWIDLYRREKLVAKPQRKSSLRLLKDEDSAAASSVPTCSREHSQGNAESRHEQKSAATSSDGAEDLESGENENEMSETVLAALRQAEAYQAAALAAAEAYASAGAQPLPSLPKILSFHKFAKLEKDTSISRKWDVYQPGCDRVVSDHGAGSTVASPLYAEAFDARPPEASIHQELATISEAEQAHTNDGENKALAGMPDGHRSSSEQIKRAVSDYVAQLLSPLYKTRKLQKDAFKSIAKKATLKVMERDGARDSEISISEFMNYKRKNKIRALVDQLVEKHLAETKRTRGS